jgi:hypothetical protein
MSGDTNPVVSDWQAPATTQVAVARPLVCFAATVVVVLDVRVAQPVSVPLSQAAPTDALVVANWASGFAPGADTEVDEPAVICARHAVVPLQEVDPLATLVLCCPFGPAVASAVAVSSAVQPASGHSACEPACPVPEKPGFPSPLCGPESRLTYAVALLATTHPDEAAVHVDSVRDSPASPEVSPVVVAVQPACRQDAVASDWAIVAGAFSTGFAASSAASTADCAASRAAFAASAADASSSAVAPGAAAIRAASSATC